MCHALFIVPIGPEARRFGAVVIPKKHERRRLPGDRPDDDDSQRFSTALQGDPAPAVERNWGAFSIFNVWTSDVHSLWGYYLAASLFLICGNFVNFIVAIGIGSLIIFFLMNLVGNAGVATGVPYPVLARANFGTFGANLPGADSGDRGLLLVRRRR